MDSEGHFLWVEDNKPSINDVCDDDEDVVVVSPKPAHTTVPKKRFAKNQLLKQNSSLKRSSATKSIGASVKKRREESDDITFAPVNVENRKTEEECQLEKLVLGRGDAIIDTLTTKLQEPSTVLRPEISLAGQGRRPAWTDSDDVTTRRLGNTLSSSDADKLYSSKLRNKFASVVGNPAWADLDAKDKVQDSGSESDDDVSYKVGDYIVKSETLEPGKLSIREQRHVAPIDSRAGPTKSVKFHPSSQVALVASQNSIVSIFQIDGATNSRIQDVEFENIPITNAEFTPDGETFIVSSYKRKYYYSYNMITGDSVKRYWNQAMDGISQHKFSLSPDGKIIVFPSENGAVHFVSLSTNEWLYSLQMNSEAVGAAFSSDSSKYYSHSVDGEVYIWDLKSRRCLHKFNDEGCIGGSSLALSPNQQYLACGSNVGVVNFYDVSTVVNSANPKPLKAILNLTTSVTDLKFNSTSEMLIFSSNLKDTSIRAFHCKSLTTFQNFPNVLLKLGEIVSMDISCNSGYLALGCSNGLVPLFRLNHYGNY